jgi:hypothetical protein
VAPYGLAGSEEALTLPPGYMVSFVHFHELGLTFPHHTFCCDPLQVFAGAAPISESKQDLAHGCLQRYV